ncbi:serine/threonine protein kinase [Haliangium ochraceum DSM 14365]|uniref:Serine/threonine protein kinase n=1 Tax=Haliangium ochraceum (strain DSM 14365 / JCM 11303 / SMP-2) TaxID=502025 RepID=D0LSY6_HALO1|nr:serine/threonine protein kinase [Haliangium ochraceum DSM 14365]
MPSYPFVSPGPGNGSVCPPAGRNATSAEERAKPAVRGGIAVEASSSDADTDADASDDTGAPHLRAHGAIGSVAVGDSVAGEFVLPSGQRSRGRDDGIVADGEDGHDGHDDSEESWLDVPVTGDENPSTQFFTTRMKRAERMRQAERLRQPARFAEGSSTRLVGSGRYRLVRRLGQGGMGITWAAHDKVLQREVAIKLVRPDLSVGRIAQMRLRREALALARLAHPNIVAVYDVGGHEGQTYIAMELVRGKTLSVWRTRLEPRPWPEVLDIFRQAAAGLASAHDAGMVHRDVKLANIIIGDDGRVRILDFGLAFVAAQPLESPPTPPNPELSSSADPLTAHGATVGTPGYMAPEQIDGHAADARSDQFSFCVSLFESLYGLRPFAGRNLRELRRHMYRGELTQTPAPTRVPRWLRAVVLRGLAFNPEERWPSMQELLAALERDPHPQRLRQMRAGAVLASMGVIAALGFAIGNRHTEEAPAGVGMCAAPETERARMWSPSQRAEIEAAVLATGAPYAASAWRQTAPLLDDYADDWQAAYIDACSEFATAPAWDELKLRRMQCLGERQRSFIALTEELAHLDVAAIDNAIEAVSQLPALAECADPEHLEARIPLPPDPVLSAQLDVARNDLVRVEKLLALGNYKEALPLARTVITTLEQIEYPPLEVEARWLLGQLLERSGDYEGAERELHAAYGVANLLGYRELARKAALSMALVVGRRMARHDEAHVWLDRASDYLAPKDDVGRAALLTQLGHLALREGHYQQANTYHRQALLLRERLWGTHHPQIADSLNSLGETARLAGHLDDALAYYQQAGDILEQTMGKSFPPAIYPLHNSGLVLVRMGEYRRAAETFERAREAWDELLGPGHLEVAYPLVALADTLLRLGDAERALPLAEEALALRERHRVTPDELAEARFVSARALYRRAQQAAIPGGSAERQAAQTRALSLARAARDGLGERPSPELQLDRATVAAWLAERE